MQCRVVKCECNKFLSSFVGDSNKHCSAIDFTNKKYKQQTYEMNFDSSGKSSLHTDEWYARSFPTIQVMMPCVVEIMDLECSERYSSSVTRMRSIRNWRWAKILLDGSRRLPPYRVHSGWLLDPKNHVTWAFNTVTRTKRWTHKDFCSRDLFVKLKVLHNCVCHKQQYRFW